MSLLRGNAPPSARRDKTRLSLADAEPTPASTFHLPGAYSPPSPHTLPMPYSFHAGTLAMRIRHAVVQPRSIRESPTMETARRSPSHRTAVWH